MTLLKVTGAQALTDLMQANRLSWIFMVSPKIASVSFSLSPINIEGMDEALGIIN